MWAKLISCLCILSSPLLRFSLLYHKSCWKPSFDAEISVSVFIYFAEYISYLFPVHQHVYLTIHLLTSALSAVSSHLRFSLLYRRSYLSETFIRCRNIYQCILLFCWINWFISYPPLLLNRCPLCHCSQFSELSPSTPTAGYRLAQSREVEHPYPIWKKTKNLPAAPHCMLLTRSVELLLIVLSWQSSGKPHKGNVIGLVPAVYL